MRYRPTGPGADLAEVFVEPSDEARALLRYAPLFVGQAPGAPASVRRHLRDAMVAPFTQLTFLSFDLQYFLFAVFHTTRIARLGHLLGMAGVNLFLMAGLTQASAALPGIDGGAVYAALILCWYAAISRDARLALWWGVMVPVVGALLALAHAFLAARVHVPGPWTSPWLLVLASAFVVSLSHAFEPRLPPRAGHPLRWMSIREFVLGPPDAPAPVPQALRRALRVAIYPWIGLVDELWAAPRLLPYNVLDLMFRLGYAPRHYARLQDHARRALASGNPAVDFVGIGGGVSLGPAD